MRGRPTGQSKRLLGSNVQGQGPQQGTWRRGKDSVTNFTIRRAFVTSAKGGHNAFLDTKHSESSLLVLCFLDKTSSMPNKSVSMLDSQIPLVGSRKQKKT